MILNKSVLVMDLVIHPTLVHVKQDTVDKNVNSITVMEF